MADPANISSAFLAGRTLTSDDIDVDADLIPIFHANADGSYEQCVISVADLYTAMSA